MSEKRYFKVEYDEEWYLFDSNTISEELVTEQAEYGYGVFANSLSPSEICERLNEQQAIIKSKDKQLERLYNYFQDYLKDEMSGNSFSEMWDNVKEDERWNNE